ncbi:MAG: Nramp family divalent metal transporter [Flavobacteriales bacterium]
MKSYWPSIGPGIALAATGIGAGDMVSTAVAGQKYGHTILWGAMAGVLIKGVITEGLARWQAGSGETLLEGWTRHLHRSFGFAFSIFLLVWSFTVGAALMAATGMAASAIFPTLSIPTWGVIHSLSAFILIFIGRYVLFERLMKGFVSLLFGIVLLCGTLLIPDITPLLKGLFVPQLPEGSIQLLLGVIGGIGGSLTVLNYGYWIREKGWKGKELLGRIRSDLFLAYLLTGLFGTAIMSIAAELQMDISKGNELVLALARTIDVQLGEWVGTLFRVAFWGAVFSSMLGVWQGVPYLFADTYQLLIRGRKPGKLPSNNDPSYKGGLLFLTLIPLPMLWLEEPVWTVVLYTVLGGLFMPVMIGSLLILNQKQILPKTYRNGWKSVLFLSIGLAIFLYLGGHELLELFGNE